MGCDRDDCFSDEELINVNVNLFLMSSSPNTDSQDERTAVSYRLGNTYYKKLDPSYQQQTNMFFRKDKLSLNSSIFDVYD